MRLVWSTAAYLTILLASNAATAAEPQATAAANAPPALAEAETKQPRGMREVTIDPNTRDPVCRRYVPTGSRISTMRCVTPQESLTAAQQADHDTMRRDVAEMRALQAMREQARTQALADMLRRRGGGQ